MKNKIKPIKINEKNILIFILVILLFFALLYMNDKNKLSKQKNSGTKLNQYAPDFETEYLNGEKFKLSEFKGKPIILNFWATWCIPCKKEMPLLQRLYDGGKIMIVGVNLHEDKKTVNKFVNELNLTFPIVLDNDGSIEAMYNIILKPATYFIDRNGIIIDKKYGELSSEDLKKRSQKLLK